MLKIRDLLCSSHRSAIADVSTFLRWERKMIDTGSCIERFKYNNDIPSRYEINYQEFELWLNSLGYIRGCK